MLGTIVTHLARKHAPDVRVCFRDGMWMHRAQDHTFVDFPALDYCPPMFPAWRNEARRLEANVIDHWFYLYKCRLGDVILDIGAGKGEDTLTFSKAVGPAGRVISIEAHPVTFRCLQMFCELNNIRNVTPRNYAVVDSVGPLAMESTTSW